MLYLCPDPTSKHASSKYDFLPEAISLLVFRLPMPICNMVLTTNRTLYLTTKSMKKIQKLIVPEEVSSDTVSLLSHLVYLFHVLLVGKREPVYPGLYTVSQKKTTDVLCYNFNAH